MRSVKPWLYLFSTADPHSLVVNDTHSQVRTATAVVRPSPRSHASAKVAVLIHLLICIDTSAEYRLARRQPDFDTSKWKGDGTPARVTSPQPITNERVCLPQSSVSLVLLTGVTYIEESNKPSILFQISISNLVGDGLIEKETPRLVHTSQEPAYQNKWQPPLHT